VKMDFRIPAGAISGPVVLSRRNRVTGATVASAGHPLVLAP
jgi:hypothetical protein